jgi:hypothetical protein
MDSVTPLPTGGGVMVVAEHRGRRDHDEPRRDDSHEPAPGGEPAMPASAVARPPRDRPPPVAEDELVPAETLFAASLIANASRAAATPAKPLPRPVERGWQPPDSSLRLKDKLI